MTGEHPRSSIAPLLFALAVSVISLITSSFVLTDLTNDLRLHHLAADVAADLGQGPSGGGLEGGARLARLTVETWDRQAAATHGDPSGRTIAARWLIVDAAFYALLGYGLLAGIILLMTCGRWTPHWLARRRATVGHRVLTIGAMLGLVVAALDLIENLLASWVISADGGGPAVILHWWGRAEVACGELRNRNDNARVRAARCLQAWR